MAASYFRNFPPYSGCEPYVYLCFHEEDARAVKPLLDALTQRRCRVWYSIGTTAKAEENHARARCAEQAALMICYLTPRAAESERIKSSLGWYLASGKPVILIETEGYSDQSGFSLLLTEHVRWVPRKGEDSVESLVSTLLRTEGFNQQLLAENDMERQIFLHKRRSRRLALGILAASLLALFGAFLFALQMGNIEQKTVYADEVIVSDAIIQKAARDTLSQQDDKTLTHRAVDAITTLHLDGTPASFEDLALFPALTRLEIPQSCVQAASQLLPEADFTIVVYPEEAHD